MDKFQYWNTLRTKSLINNPLKRTPLVRKGKPIRKVSDKRAKELRIYEKEKALFFEEVTSCQFPGCEIEYQTLHHAKGRIGDNLTNREFFRCLCPIHHQWVEENPAEAKMMGLSADRL